MYVVLANGHPGEGVSWWGPFGDAEAADEFIETAAEVLDCLRVELCDPALAKEFVLDPRLPPERP